MQFNAILSTTPLHQTLWHPNLSLSAPSFLKTRSGTPLFYFFPSQLSLPLPFFSLFQLLNNQSIQCKYKNNRHLPHLSSSRFHSLQWETANTFSFSTQTVDFIASMFLNYPLSTSLRYPCLGALFKLLSLLLLLSTLTYLTSLEAS